MLADLIANGRIVDIVIVFMFVEALALFALWRAAGRGVAPADLVFMLLAGLSLLLALRAALTGAQWIWVAILLLAALIAHLGDLWRRWAR